MSSVMRVEKKLNDHYTSCLQSHGPTAKGVGWKSEDQVRLRYNRMLRVIDSLYDVKNPTLLDAGCGYGGFLDYLREKNEPVRYTGIDVLDTMIQEARKRHPKEVFIRENILEYVPKEPYDYVICNGVLTLKMGSTFPEMDAFFKSVVKKLLGLCKVGMAFNVYSTYVGWFGEITYYKNPLEILAYCLSELSVHVKIDHAYRDYEYTVYVYQPDDVLKSCDINRVV